MHSNNIVANALFYFMRALGIILYIRLFLVRCDTLTSRLPWSHAGLRANRRHHVFLPGSLIGLRSVARTG